MKAAVRARWTQRKISPCRRPCGRLGFPWIFGGKRYALFGLVSSGLGLFNEAVLAERGFDQKTYYAFLVVTTIISLFGQLLCGWLALRWPLKRLTGIALFLYAFALALLPFVRTPTHLWIATASSGAPGESSLSPSSRFGVMPSGARISVSSREPRKF